jgi:predicted nucleic acid-binding protein
MSKFSNKALVLDCSFTMAWCFEDETSERTEQVLDALTEITAWVPALWSVEVANSLIVAERKKRLTHIKAMAFREYLTALRIEVDNYLLKQPIEIILDLAKETGLTAYDATYLELAVRRNLPIATLDQDLKKAAKKLGIDII